MPVTTRMLVRTGHPQAGAAPLVGTAAPSAPRPAPPATRSSGRSLCCTLPAARPAAGEHQQARPRHEEGAALPPAERPPAPRRATPTTWMADQHARRRHLVQPREEPHRPEQRRRLPGQIGVGPGGEAEAAISAGDAQRASPARARPARARTATGRARSTRSVTAAAPAALVQRASARAAGRRAGRSPRSRRCARATTSTPSSRSGPAHASQISSRSRGAQVVQARGCSVVVCR